MLPANTVGWGAARSCIRTLAEYGAVRKKEIGAENVYDFSLGNPSIPAPDCVNGAIAELLKGDSVALHGYTTAAGVVSLREKIAEELNGRYGTHLTPDHLYVTCGAAAALCIALRAVLFPGDEVIVPAPFFPEYRVFTEASGGVLAPVPPRGDLQIDVEALERALTPRTRAVIINSPNNPSGVIYSVETLKTLAELLTRKSKEIGHPIYIFSDEPYRELTYDGLDAAYIPAIYPNTIICYSYSKILSMPGERIGYVCVPDCCEDSEAVYAAIAGAARALGHVCAPSLWQRVVARNTHLRPDLATYDNNRKTLYAELTKLGFRCVKPQGAFYMMVAAPDGNSEGFSDRAKELNILGVPCDGFGCPGFVRFSTCVSPAMIQRSLPSFKKLAESYGL